jgi:hypothetical protein
MLGPTPGEEPVDALRRIHDAETRYVATNIVDIVASAVLLLGFVILGRMLCASQTDTLVPTLAIAGTIVGSILLLVVLVLESAVDPQIAARFVSATESEGVTHLAVAEAMFDFEDGLFALALLLMMWGFTAIAAALLRVPDLAVDRRFLWAGAVVSFIAGWTGVAFLFEELEWFGRTEPFFSLLALVWLGVLGFLLTRGSGTASSRTQPHASSAASR